MPLDINDPFLEGSIRNIIQEEISSLPVLIRQLQNTARWTYSGTGTPEGNITAPVGSVYHRTDGGAATSLYVKESGTGNTGWVGK